MGTLKAAQAFIGVADERTVNISQVREGWSITVYTIPNTNGTGPFTPIIENYTGQAVVTATYGSNIAALVFLARYVGATPSYPVADTITDVVAIQNNTGTRISLYGSGNPVSFQPPVSVSGTSKGLLINNTVTTVRTATIVYNNTTVPEVT